MGKSNLASDSDSLKNIVLLRSKGDVIQATSIAQRLSIAVLESSGLSIDVLIGECRLKEGHLAESEFNLKKGVKTEIGKEEAICILSKLYFQLKDYRTALDSLEDIRFEEIKSRLTALMDGKDFKMKKKSGKMDNVTYINSLIISYFIGLLIEAACIKIKCLLEFGEMTGAVAMAKFVSNSIFLSFSESPIDKPWMEGKLIESISGFVQLIPKIYKNVHDLPNQISFYRTILSSSFVSNLSPNLQKQVRKDLAICLLCGQEEDHPWKDYETEGEGEEERIEEVNASEGFVEEAMDLLKQAHSFRKWEDEITKPLCFVLNLRACHDDLIQLYESLMPGELPRWLRWRQLAKSHHAKGDDCTALELLRKVLQPGEKPEDVQSIILAGKICSHDAELAQEGATYVRRILNQSRVDSLTEKTKGLALHVLGVCLFVHSQTYLSDAERTKLEAEAKESLCQASELRKMDPNLLFDLALVLASSYQISEAATQVRKCLDLGKDLGYSPWILLALLLTAQKRLEDADEVCSIALKENLGSEKYAEGYIRLLRTKAKIQLGLGNAVIGLEIFQKILKWIKVKSKSQNLKRISWDDMELMTWHDVAELYIHLKQWKDAEACISKAKVFNSFNARTYYLSGLLEEKQGNKPKALKEYENSLALDSRFVESQIRLGILYLEAGKTTVPIARSYLKGLLLHEPKNPLAWHYLGLLNKATGSWEEAAVCFRVSLMFGNSVPIIPFSFISFSFSFIDRIR